MRQPSRRMGHDALRRLARAFFSVCASGDGVRSCGHRVAGDTSPRTVYFQCREGRRAETTKQKLW